MPGLLEESTLNERICFQGSRGPILFELDSEQAGSIHSEPYDDGLVLPETEIFLAFPRDMCPKLITSNDVAFFE